MIKKSALVLICISWLLLMAGCGDSETVPGEEDGIVIEVANYTDDIIIAYAAFFGEGLEQWGEDLLGDEVIEPGESYTFIMPEGEYNLSLFSSDLFVINSYFDISEDRTIEVGGDNMAAILVQNPSDYDILFFYAFPSGIVNLDPDHEEMDEDWGLTWDEIWEGEEYEKYQLLDDREGIIAETGRRFFFLTPGTYDFLVINEEIEPYLEIDVSIEREDRKVLTVE